jgi:hypothetical protein
MKKQHVIKKSKSMEDIEDIDWYRIIDGNIIREQIQELIKYQQLKKEDKNIKNPLK